MEKPIGFPVLINLASKLKELLDSLVLEYSRLPDIIRKEHRGIQIHDFFEIESAFESKQAMSQRVELLVDALMTQAKALKCEYERVFSSPWNRHLGARECTEILLKLAEKCPTDKFAFDVLNHTCIKLIFQVTAFEKLSKDIKPEIEKNQLALEKLLRNHQESFRYFIDLIKKETSSYDSRGVKKGSGGNSTLEIKA